MTETLLRIDASARHTGSLSRTACDELERTIGARHVLRRDLAAEPLPQVNGEWVAARLVDPAERTPEDAARLTLSDRLVAELQEADAILIATPIYNFGIPAALKAWIDLVARPGVTFRYGPDGPEGLLHGKSVQVAVASGGTAIGSPIDFATPYLRHALAFIGLTDVSFVEAASVIRTPEPA